MNNARGKEFRTLCVGTCCARPFHKTKIAVKWSGRAQDVPTIEQFMHHEYVFVILNVFYSPNIIALAGAASASVAFGEQAAILPDHKSRFERYLLSLRNASFA